MELSAHASTDSLLLNDLSITAAVAPASVYAVLGVPSRIYSAGPPAPYGHRNNQIHVYDTLGVYFNEHHHTQLLSSMTFVFWQEQEELPFTPACDFSGRMHLGTYEVPRAVSEKGLITQCGLPFAESLRGWWDLKGVITISLTTKPSERKSRHRRLVSISIGWPHDPWMKVTT